MILPQIDNDSKEELHIDEHDVRDLRQQLDMLHSSCDEEFQETSESRGTRFFSMGGCESEQYASCNEESEAEETNSEEPESNPLHDSLSISVGRPSDAFSGPMLSESPKIGNTMRKSVVFSSKSNQLPTSEEENVVESLKFSSNVTHESLRISNQIRSSLRSSKIFGGGGGGPTESLAASLQRGLEIIDNHQRNSVLNKSLVALSFDHLATKTKDKEYICSTCQQKASCDDVQDSLKTWIVPGTSESMKKVKDLENLCMEQKAEIERLNSLVRYIL